MDRKPLKEIRCWAVTGWSGMIYLSYLGYTRNSAIETFISSNTREGHMGWKWFYRKGWRCVQVAIQPLTAAAPASPESE